LTPKASSQALNGCYRPELLFSPRQFRDEFKSGQPPLPSTSGSLQAPEFYYFPSKLFAIFSLIIAKEKCKVNKSRVKPF